MKDQVTVFQLEVEKGINDVLAHFGKHVVDRRIGGIAEIYITGTVSNQDVIFWIYPDSAALQVGRRHRAFGYPKRESLLDTAREFLDEFMKVVDGPAKRCRDSGSRAVSLPSILWLILSITYLKEQVTRLAP